jgi:hypothetical protein
MTTTATQPEIEKMEALIDEMSITIKNLASMAAAHGLMDPYVNHRLHDVIDGDLNRRPLDEILDALKKVNAGSRPEWSFLNLG